tara:strand:+ start:1736 stop:3364 length:1629 start_codon:yes stop_codon:yes gene_type:complete
MTGYDIGFYGSHNGAFAVSKDGKIVEVLEIERLINEKNCGIAQYKTVKPADILYFSKYFGSYLTQRYGIEKFDRCFHQNTEVIIDGKNHNLHQDIPSEQYYPGFHHQAHASGTFYQSDFKSALIFSFDGGGNDGFFNVYLGRRQSGVTLLGSIYNPVTNSPHLYLDLGFPYMLLGHYIEEIKQEIDISAGNLVYPGKLMGLAAYGVVQENWLSFFYDYYQCINNGDTYKDVLEKLGSSIGLKFNEKERFNTEIGRNLAATSQRAFEDIFIKHAKPFIDQYQDLPICLSGGCALNITLNTRVAEEFNKKVFVGPNPNDCGLAVGMLLNEIKPKTPSILTYSGPTLFDIDSLGEYINQSHYSCSSILDINKLADDLIEGKIVGVARDRSEHGPRALGNRSILCNPAIKDMKDILNSRVKNREAYRPFAPVVRLEDVNKFFEWNTPSAHMNFSPLVKEEWRSKLASITHIDNTARIQTVTREENSFLYELLSIIDSKNGVGILLNTSFNVAGKPILNTVKDAFTIFHKTEMDNLLIENNYLEKLT